MVSPVWNTNHNTNIQMVNMKRVLCSGFGAVWVEVQSPRCLNDASHVQKKLKPETGGKRIKMQLLTLQQVSFSKITTHRATALNTPHVNRSE